MADRPITHCGDCAYVIKENGRMWCPFHDVAVSSKLVCDDFLDEYDSPQWRSLTTEMTGTAKKQYSLPQHTAKDIIAYIISGSMVLLAVIAQFIKL